MAIDPRLDSKPVTDEQHRRITKIKQEASDLMAVIEQVADDPRMKAIATCALEEAVMWAVKAITHASL